MKTQTAIRYGLTIGALLTLTVMAMAARADAVASASAEVTPLPPVTEADGSMGTCYSFYETSGESLLPHAYQAGSRWDRYDFSWNRIEAEPNVFSFEPHERIILQDLQNGIDVVGILGSTPLWAASACFTSAVDRALAMGAVPGHPSLASSVTGSDWQICPPRNLYLPWSDPDNYWGDFVYQTVLHFRDDVHVWEIWNEPDLTAFWVGSPQDYAQLLRVGYQAAKAADPTATVLFGGLAYWANRDFYVAVLDTLTAMPDGAANGYFFDVMSLHLYSNVYTIGSVSSSIQNAVTARVGPHPIWLTETGVPLWDENPFHPGVDYDNAATIEEAAAYTIESYAEARRQGVAKYFFFRMHDEAMSEAFGLMRNDLSYRPAYLAYQVAARYLHGENQVTGPFTDGYVRRITFWGTPQGRIDVLWNTAGTDIGPVTHTIASTLPTATLVNHRGETQTLTAGSGSYTLSLQPATARNSDGTLIIGGPPVLLIQTDTVPPVSALAPLPATVYSDTVTLTWTASDDAAGYWYEEIERAPAATGPWTLVAGYAQTRPGVQQAAVSLPAEGPWYFRARARDKVGNYEAWPASAEAWTTAILTRTVTLSVTVYLDADSSGTWDAGEVPPTTTTTLRWITPSGGILAETTGTTWQVTRTVPYGAYQLYARTADWLPAWIAFTVEPGATPLTVSLAAGLRPINDRAYLPLVTRRS